MEVSDVKYDQGVDDERFTEAALPKRLPQQP
jgi:hypothetical protein